MDFFSGVDTFIPSDAKIPVEFNFIKKIQWKHHDALKCQLSLSKPPESRETAQEGIGKLWNAFALVVQVMVKAEYKT